MMENNISFDMADLLEDPQQLRRTDSFVVADAASVDRHSARRALAQSFGDVSMAIHSLTAERIHASNSSEEPMAMLLQTSSEVPFVSKLQPSDCTICI